MPARLRLIAFIAVLAGILATYGLYTYMEKQKSTAGTEPLPVKRVVVASQDLAVGRKLVGTDLKLVEWPEDLIPPGAIPDTSLLIGRALRINVFTDELLMESKLAPLGSQSGLPSLIPPGMRAMTVSVDNFSGVYGFILPQTRVDVLVTLPSPWNSRESYTKIILQNILVLAIDQSYMRVNDEQNKPAQGVTLLVTPREAEKLGLAAAEGELQFALRNNTDESIKQAYGIRNRELLYRPPAKTSTGKPAPQKREIEVIRSGERTKVTVSGEEVNK